MGRTARYLAVASLAALASCSGGGSSSPGPSPECAVAADCGTAAHGIYACTSGACALASCDAGWEDCDALHATGCEVDVAGDARNCGTCGNACGAEDACVASVCTAVACLPGSACGSDGGQICDGAGACVPASVVVVQVGDGSAALTSAATQVSLRRFQLDGTELQPSIAVPTAASGSNGPLTLSGSATSEGALSRSADFRYLVLAGYGAAPGTAGVTGAPSTTVSRVVGRVDAAGNVDTSTALTDAYGVGNVRGATSADGTAFWACGTSATSGGGGVRYAALGSATSTQVLATPSNVRTCQIFGGQLYAGSGSTGYTSVFTVGAGLPTTAGQPGTLLPGLPMTGASPYGFLLLDRDPDVAGVDALYVADDRSLANGGGIQKWTFDGATWTLAATFSNGLTTGVRGLAGWIANGAVVLVATDASRLLTVVDDGSAAPPFTLLATAPANTAFRGVAPAPNP